MALLRSTLKGASYCTLVHNQIWLYACREELTTCVSEVDKIMLSLLNCIAAALQHLIIRI